MTQVTFLEKTPFLLRVFACANKLAQRRCNSLLWRDKKKIYICILENNVSVCFSELSETKYRKLSDLKQQKLTQSEIKIVFENNLKHKFTQLILQARHLKSESRQVHVFPEGFLGESCTPFSGVARLSWCCLTYACFDLRPPWQHNVFLCAFVQSSLFSSYRASSILD